MPMSPPPLSIIRADQTATNNGRPLDAVIKASSHLLSQCALGVALGTDENGAPVVFDLADAPHLLVAGTTGSGKSVCTHVILANLLLRHAPTDLRLLLIDTNRLEFNAYNEVPHLRHGVVTNPSDAVSVLKWAACEIASRAEQFAPHGNHSLEDFNLRGRATASFTSLPRIVIIVDDLADVTAVDDDAGHVCEMIAHQGRSVGIHLVAVTQRPTAVSVPAPLKSLFASRIAFRLPSAADSRSILDRPGAERLPGVGASILIAPQDPDGVTVQNAFLGYSEVDALVNWWRMQTQSESVDFSILDQIALIGLASNTDDDAETEDTRDTLFDEAAEIVVQNQSGSTALLQRRLKIGYGRAARIMDQLQLAGVLGPSDGPRGREVLVTLADLLRVRSRPGHVSATAAAASLVVPPTRKQTAAATELSKEHDESQPAEAAPVTQRMPLIDRILRRLGG